MRNRSFCSSTYILLLYLHDGGTLMRACLFRAALNLLKSAAGLGRHECSSCGMTENGRHHLRANGRPPDLVLHDSDWRKLFKCMARICALRHCTLRNGPSGHVDVLCKKRRGLLATEIEASG
jgi:hypothetical protein